jgi:hypothetical protein
MRCRRPLTDPSQFKVILIRCRSSPSLPNKSSLMEGPGLHPAKTPRFDGKPIRLRLATVALVDVKRAADLYAQGLTLRQMSFVAMRVAALLPLIEIQLTSRPAPGV